MQAVPARPSVSTLLGAAAVGVVAGAVTRSAAAAGQPWLVSATMITLIGLFAGLSVWTLSRAASLDGPSREDKTIAAVGVAMSSVLVALFAALFSSELEVPFAGAAAVGALLALLGADRELPRLLVSPGEQVQARMFMRVVAALAGMLFALGVGV